jgi:hypothetical protein
MQYSGKGFPWTTFLFIPADRFADWNNSVVAASTLRPYLVETKAVSAYFPFTYEVFSLIHNLFPTGSIPIYIFISILLLSLGIGSIAWQEKINKFYLLTLIPSCVILYPVLFSIDRGNIDVWISSLCIIYVALLRSRHYWIGFACLSLAISMKGYPLAFLVLAVPERRFKAIFLSLIASLLLTATSLSLMTGRFLENLEGFLSCLGRYRDVYVIGPNSLFASSDPYNGIRTLNIFNGAQVLDIAEWSAYILKFYNPISLVFACASAFFVVLNPKLEYWKQVLVICLVTILFPNVANDYKLTMLLPGLLLLITKPDSYKKYFWMLTMLCLLMIPKSYFFYKNLGITNIINPILLLCIASMILIEYFRDRPLSRTQFIEVK